MAKRKVEESADDNARTKKAKLTAKTSVVVGSGALNKDVSKDASSIATASAIDAMENAGQVKEDVKGKGKAVETGSEPVDDQEMEDDQEGNGGSAVETPSTPKVAPAHKIRKLAPPRPYPTVPTAVSATGPRSAHTGGKNYICVTRKTQLGAYLRRCKDVVLKDGYKTLHLNAMGAAIPHLLQLSVSLPCILPHPPEDIHTEVLTGTVEVQDEVIPDDEDEDISIRTRGISTLSVVIKIGDGVDEVLRQTKNKGKGRNAHRAAAGSTNKPYEHHKKGRKKNTALGTAGGPERIVIREEDMDQDQHM